MVCRYILDSHLEDGAAQHGLEVVMSVGGEGRAARHDGPHPAPHQLPDAAEDESVHDGGHLHIITIITIIITIIFITSPLLMHCSR